VSAIEADALAKRFGETDVVQRVDLEVDAGELFGLVGPDGAGKTTTMRMLAGVLSPSGGEVRVLGRDPRDPKLRQRVGLVPQEHTLYGDLSIDENLAFFGRLFALPRDTYRARRDELLRITRLQPFTRRGASALSGGMYKKLALACALLHQPEVVLLDEPTNGVDPVSRRQLWDLLYRFVDEGTTVVVSTPYMDEAARCHRVAMMHRGVILESGAPGEIIAAMPERAFVVEGGAREAVHDVIERSPFVVAASPAGARLRLVVAEVDVPLLEEALAPLDARLAPTELDFEDAFLASIARAEAA